MTFRLTIERRASPDRRAQRVISTVPLVTRDDLVTAMAVVQDYIQQAKHNGVISNLTIHRECRQVTLVLHLPDCDHEP